MSDRNSHEIKEVKWEGIDNNVGEIRFRKRRGITKIHSFVRGVVIVVVAALSGGAGGAYIINKKLINNNSYNKQLLQSRNIDIQTSEGSRSFNDKSVDDVGVHAVGITNKVNEFLGVNGGIVSSQSNRVQGFYISEVEKGSSAALAGIKPTDILLEIDNINIKKYEDLLKVMDKHIIGDCVKCKIWRNGKIEDLNIVFTEIKNNGNK